MDGERFLGEDEGFLGVCAGRVVGVSWTSGLLASVDKYGGWMTPLSWGCCTNSF